MTWRRWEFRDAKDDVREYHVNDVPQLPGLPKRLCSICHYLLHLTPNEDQLPRVVRRGSKAVHVRAPESAGRRLRRTRCGRYYTMEKK